MKCTFNVDNMAAAVVNIAVGIMEVLHSIQPVGYQFARYSNYISDSVIWDVNVFHGH